MGARQVELFVGSPFYTCKSCKAVKGEVFRADPVDVTQPEGTPRVFSWWCLACYGGAERRANL